MSYRNHKKQRRIRALSKSKFLAGTQCGKRLYLEVYRRDLLPPIDRVQQALFDTGSHVGKLAQKRFPNIAVVDEPYFHHQRAVEKTKRFLGDERVSSIAEAAFAYGEINVRADLLLRIDNDQFDLVEVKSGTKSKPEHESDLAIQLHVLEGSGIAVRNTLLMRLDNSYVFQGGDYELDQLFVLDDLTSLVRPRLEEVPAEVDSMRRILEAEEEPNIDIGPQCTDPYPCPFQDYCGRASYTEFPVSEFPRIREPMKEQFSAEGIVDISEIPEDHSNLKPLYRRIRQAVITGDSFIDEKIMRELDEVVYPVRFMDFETFMPALPLYVGTRPYEAIPFQWSVHTLDEQGNLVHEEFLHEGKTDPREAFTDCLLDCLGEIGSIVVYSPYEAGVIRRLARTLPDRSKQLNRLQGRLFDLLPLIREHVYHRDFRGSFSIKKVLPALVPKLDYSGLTIADGRAASVAFAEALEERTSVKRRKELRADLLSYCKLDTGAMLELFRVLREGGR